MQRIGSMICYIKIIDFSLTSNTYSFAKKIKANIKDIEYNLLMSFTILERKINP